MTPLSTRTYGVTVNSKQSTTKKPARQPRKVTLDPAKVAAWTEEQCRRSGVSVGITDRVAAKRLVQQFKAAG